MKVVEWTQPALADMAGLDRSVAIRIKNAIERFAGTGAGNVRALTGIDPLEFRSATGVSGFIRVARRSTFFGFATVAKFELVNVTVGSRKYASGLPAISRRRAKDINGPRALSSEFW